MEEYPFIKEGGINIFPEKTIDYFFYMKKFSRESKIFIRTDYV